MIWVNYYIINLIKIYFATNTINIMRLIFISQRTGSLSKLQKAMGHSSLAVSLFYLRGLEVTDLEESDMPAFSYSHKVLLSVMASSQL